jgi:TolB-like protein/tRNA A-37 threonylcarbamoyl transferase component Bud32/Flp pilus assembly protein TadD
MTIEAGQQLSHYRLIEKIGEGGMGVVWKARDTVLDRHVAIKILPANVSLDEQRREKFLEEAKLASSISDANIVEIHSFAREGDLDFIVMEYIEGTPLSEIIRGRSMPPDRVVELGAQIAGALSQAHRKGLLHRDLKPANILVTPDDKVKIVDFGLAVLFRHEDTLRDAEAITRSLLDEAGDAGWRRRVAGTLPYMSPEQTRGEELDARSDIFSMGAILYEMTTGRRPFGGTTAAEIMASIVKARPDSPHTAVSGLPLELDRIIRKALARKPSDRYQSADDLAVDLTRLSRELESGDSLSYGDVAPGRARPSGRRALPWVLAAMVLVSLAIGAWWILSGRGEAPAGPGRISSLAVLPLDNLMGDEEQDYFVDGMHEALITDLAKIGSLRVISRTSVVRYRNTDQTIPEIAAELGVDALIEGSVLRADGLVRITAQLIDGRTDEHLWAENYDRKAENTLQLLSEVSRAIASEIEITLTPRQEELLAPAGSVNPEAHDALMRGIYHFNQGSAENFRLTRKHCERALEIEPSFARAWSFLAGSNLVLGFFGAEPVADTIPAARKAARQAIALDEREALAHLTLGYAALFFDWDWEEARRELELALELNPTNVLVHHGYADYLGVMGKLEQSLEQVLLGRRYDPFGYWANQFLIGHMFMAGRYAEAVEEGKQMIELFPTSTGIRNFYALSLWQLGRYEEALDQYAQGWGADADFVQTLQSVYAEGGPEAALRARADQLAALSESQPVDALSIALYYAFAGDVDPAFVWLERALEKRTPQILHIPMDPRFDSLRSDPRYKDLMERIGLPVS